MERTGLEPATPSLQSYGHLSEPVENKALAEGVSDERTNKRTRFPKSAPKNTPERDFAEAMKMIAELPLSDAEKAEAVRRLLLGHGDGEHVEGRGKIEPDRTR